MSAPVALSPYNPGVTAVPAMPQMDSSDAGELTIKSFEGGNNWDGATWTYSDKALGLVYKTRLHPLLKFIPCFAPFWMLTSPRRSFRGCGTCSCICDYTHFDDVIHPRSYQAIYENRIELNYPYHMCCGMCVDDQLVVRHFDRVYHIEDATFCTPYHCACIYPCVGPVLAEAPCDAVNKWFLPCCRDHYPSIDEPRKFIQEYEAAKRAFAEGKRKVPKFLTPGPTPASAAKAKTDDTQAPQ